MPVTRFPCFSAAVSTQTGGCTTRTKETGRERFTALLDCLGGEETEVSGVWRIFRFDDFLMLSSQETKQGHRFAV